MQNFGDRESVLSFVFAVAIGFAYGSALLSELGAIAPISS